MEFIRDIVIKDKENKGSIILHAAAVHKNDKVVAISGAKGAGKSTATMELIFNAGYEFFTGDKLFVRVKDNKIIAKGWPDYPHLGVGTISRYDTLIDYCGTEKIQNADPSDKIIFSPEDFYDIAELKVNNETGVLSAFIFPQFNVNNASNVIKVDNVAQKIEANIEYKEDFPMSQWHEMVKKKYNRDENQKILCECLEQIPGYSWKGNFNAQDVVVELGL